MLTKAECLKQLILLKNRYDEIASRVTGTSELQIQYSIAAIITLLNDWNKDVITTDEYLKLCEPAIETKKLSRAFVPVIWASVLASDAASELNSLDTNAMQYSSYTQAALQYVVRKIQLQEPDKFAPINLFCPECGVKLFQNHRKGCSIEHCSICGEAKTECSCESHNPEFNSWKGTIPGEFECYMLDILVLDPKTLNPIPNLNLFYALQLDQLFFIENRNPFQKRTLTLYEVLKH